MLLAVGNVYSPVTLFVDDREEFVAAVRGYGKKAVHGVILGALVQAGVAVLLSVEEVDLVADQQL